jgi:hypothetical protein
MLGRALAKNENVLKFKTHRIKRDETVGIIGVASNHRYIDRNTGREVVSEKRKESRKIGGRMGSYRIGNRAGDKGT